MMERVRILVVATPTAPIRGLAARLRDPDVDVIMSASAREALERVSTTVPDVIVVDGSLPGRDIFRLYGRLRGLANGASVPIIFSAHDRTDADAAPATALDYYLGPDATLDDVEQLIFTFLPESLVETEEPESPAELEEPEPADELETFKRALGANTQRPYVTPPTARPARSPAGPSARADAIARMQSGPAAIAFAYLGIYVAAEVLAAGLDTRLGLLVHGGLLLAMFFHGYNVPPGPERTFFLAFWLAPLTRIYGLAQPYANVSPLMWWAFTAVPMVVAGAVALRLGGLTAREAGLVPAPRHVPIAVLLLPVGLALGVVMYLLLDPGSLARDLATANVGLVALVVILNPGIVDEIAFAVSCNARPSTGSAAGSASCTPVCSTRRLSRPDWPPAALPRRCSSRSGSACCLPSLRPGPARS